MQLSLGFGVLVHSPPYSKATAVLVLFAADMPLAARTELRLAKMPESLQSSMEINAPPTRFPTQNKAPRWAPSEELLAETKKLRITLHLSCFCSLFRDEGCSGWGKYWAA